MFECNYDELCMKKENSEYELPKGIYHIAWDKFFTTNLSRIDSLCVELSGIFVPNNNITFCICAHSINYLQYHNNMVGVYFSN